MPGFSRPRLDLRGPLVLDTREMGRRAGSMRRARLTVPAPSTLGAGLVGVPPGADLELDLRLESVVEGILVSGVARARLVGECSRCLEPLTSSAEVDLQQLFVYPDLRGEVSDPGQDDLGVLVEDRLDLEPVIRDAVVLALPLSPRCRDDCPGLCATCGERLAELPADHAHPVNDPRWAALSGLREPSSSSGGPDGPGPRAAARNASKIEDHAAIEDQSKIENHFKIEKNIDIQDQES